MKNKFLVSVAVVTATLAVATTLVRPYFVSAGLNQDAGFQYTDPITKNSYSLKDAAEAFKTLSRASVTVAEDQMGYEPFLRKCEGCWLLNKDDGKWLWYVMPGTLKLYYFDGSDKSFAFIKTLAQKTVPAAKEIKVADWDSFIKKVIAKLTSPGLVEMTAQQVASSTQPLLCSEKMYDKQGKLFYDNAFIIDNGRFAYRYSKMLDGNSQPLFIYRYGNRSYVWTNDSGQQLDLSKASEKEVYGMDAGLSEKIPYRCTPWTMSELSPTLPKNVKFEDVTADWNRGDLWEKFQDKIDGFLNGSSTQTSKAEILASTKPLICKVTQDDQTATFIFNGGRFVYLDMQGEATTYIIGDYHYAEVGGSSYKTNLTKIDAQTRQKFEATGMLDGADKYSCAEWSMADFPTVPRDDDAEDLTDKYAASTQ